MFVVRGCTAVAMLGLYLVAINNKGQSPRDNRHRNLSYCVCIVYSTDPLFEQHGVRGRRRNIFSFV